MDVKDWAILGLVGAGVYWWYKGGSLITETLNPASDKNIVYKTTNKVLGLERQKATVGTKLYDVAHEPEYKRVRTAAYIVAAPVTVTATVAVGAAKFVKNDKNIVYRNVNRVLGLDNKTASIGTKIYDWLH